MILAASLAVETLLIGCLINSLSRGSQRVLHHRLTSGNCSRRSARRKEALTGTQLKDRRSSDIVGGTTRCFLAVATTPEIIRSVSQPQIPPLGPQGFLTPPRPT